MVRVPGASGGKPGQAGGVRNRSQAVQTMSLPATQSLAEEEVCGSTALHLANAHLCFLLESITFFTSPGLFTQTSCSLTTRIAFSAILLTAQMSAVSLGVWWELSRIPPSPGSIASEETNQGHAGSQVGGRSLDEVCWQVQPPNGDRALGLPEMRHFPENKGRQRIFSSRGNGLGAGEGGRHERMDETPDRGRDLAGRGLVSSRETLSFSCGPSKALPSPAFSTSGNKKWMRKITNNYPSS